jgi:hypothetical protein
MSHYETRVTHDIGESGIAPLSMAELIAFEPEAERAALTASLLTLPLGYSEARGTETLRAALAATYRTATPDPSPDGEFGGRLDGRLRSRHGETALQGRRAAWRFQTIGFNT